MYANTAIFALAQSGVIPDTFVLTTKDQTWDELIPDRTDLTSVKSYISLKTRLIFDPPDKQGIVDAINRTISEIEYRLNLQVEVINP